jgi:hypothetical protein
MVLAPGRGANRHLSKCEAASHDHPATGASLPDLDHAHTLGDR